MPLSLARAQQNGHAASRQGPTQGHENQKAAHDKEVAATVTHDVIKIPKLPAGQAEELSSFRDQCAAGVPFPSKLALPHSFCDRTLLNKKVSIPVKVWSFDPEHATQAATNSQANTQLLCHTFIHLL